jgi:NAD(P)-dependent dehydrogenase (short-subunit alcohol dehydrogenase family)
MSSKIVLITGCSTGIGHNLARRLTRVNYTMVATARHLETMTDLHVALQLPLDVTDPTSVASATQEVVRCFGHIDVLVNNAGYAVRGAVEDIPVEQVQHMFEVNVYGVLRMIRAVVPYMRQHKSGRVITLGSLAGKLVLPVMGRTRRPSVPWKPSVMLCAWIWHPLAFRWCSSNRGISVAISWPRLKPTRRGPSLILTRRITPSINTIWE